MYLLDTNIVSEAMKKKPDEGVLAWLARHEDEASISSITLDELWFGVLSAPEGKRREEYRRVVSGLVRDYPDKILWFDAEAALVSAEFRHAARSIGQNPGVQDMMIAAVAKTNGLILATRNVKDFAFLGIDIVNPFDSSEGSC